MKNSKEIIEEIENLLIELKRSLSIKQNYRQEKEIKISSAKESFSGLTKEIFDLVKEGYFEKPKTISEIQKKLRDEGTSKPTTSLMKPILLLVRKKILGRNKPEKGVYKYYQRGR
ncbi:MAG: hypothetical protein Q8R05_00760 [Candidatus Omnitrophota bacterium]|nr:hypothetical protein [Candidatus Omnitrophota bacterium]